MKVTYTCHACREEFTLYQFTEDRDEEIDLCWKCIDVMFDSESHGTYENPWTTEKIREARKRRERPGNN